MEYNFIPPELIVGSKEQKAFKKWIWINHQFHTRNRLKSLRTEYLNQYLEEYIAFKLNDIESTKAKEYLKGSL